jgi:hypothetical protein
MRTSTHTNGSRVYVAVFHPSREEIMGKQRFVLLAMLLALVLTWLPAPAFAEADAPPTYPLEACEKGAFSVEEDFEMQEGKAYDGDPTVSDGDVLSTDGQVCARNRDLLVAFSPAGALLPDLGLDALDILDIPQRLVAFSTEIDHPAGLFTSGDLLVTNGAVIPNLVLVHAFGIDHDIGLDGVQLFGKAENVVRFATAIREIRSEAWLANPEKLQELLKEYRIDIWFTIEGSWSLDHGKYILDGDLLAASGTVVAGNDVLLAPPVPAGIPVRGVDFGLDGIATRRTEDKEAALAGLRHSSEILFWGEPGFTDGDVLDLGGAVITLNETLVNPFHPAADFIGLDALSYIQPKKELDPMITMIGNQSTWDIDGGFVAPGDPGTGLYAASPGVEPQHPFGWFVPIDGHIPAGIHDFRVAFRPAGAPRPAPGVAPGISTSWKTWEWDGAVCNDTPIGTYKDDGNGWFEKAEYDLHRYTDIICPDWGIQLAVWDTWNDANVTDKDGHYVLWLEWRNAPMGPIFQEPADHHVQLDNTAPEIKKFELHTPEGDVVDPCGDTGAGTDVLHVHAEIVDDYFSGYLLKLSGGDPPLDIVYGWHNYWDGTPEVANLNGQGTTPAGLQLLRPIDMNDLGDSFDACCYELRLWASDRGIRHGFNHFFAYPGQPWAWPDEFLTFAAAP